MLNIRALFDHECAHLLFDKHLAKKISDFVVGFVNKNEEHMTFFGGHLTGVKVVRFTPADRDKWFEIFEINDVVLEEKLLEIPAIDPDRIVSSDLFNHVCVWLMHRFMTTPHMGPEDKQEAAVGCALVMNFRFLTSLLHHYYKYPADPELAEATYNRLSNKFLLKQYGSWYATLRGRSLAMVDRNSIHYHTFMNFENDLDIVYLINDSQGRIRDMMKNIYAVLDDTKKKGIRIAVSSSMVELDGESILKDKNKGLQGYARYLHSIISDKNSFIKDELIKVISDLQHTMPPKLLIDTLEWCCHNYRFAGSKDIEDLIDKTLVHSFSYLSDNRTLVKHTTDLLGLLSRLRGVYMSSRSTDSELIDLRETAERVVRSATTTKNDSVISSVRTGLLLYIVLRAYTSHHYGG
jgi:hypothetical protein